ncbi:hypothetical protein AB0I89_26635 [Micromonospora sp. NPDC049801]|uniref:hypothetical protein n=1 Tax=unclassified Micromonospora TaxID=2617518 RepID=UPI0033D8E065
MARKQASAADAALIAATGECGAAPTPTQLERWRAGGLLPRNVQHGAGQGRGSVSTVPPGAVELAIWLTAHARPGRRPDDLALEAFAAGLPVPEPTVRAALVAASTDFRLDVPPEPDTGAMVGRSDWIAEVAQEYAAEHGGRSVLLPRRIRDIDARIAGAGIPFALPELAPFDKGTYDTEPYTSRDLLTTAVAAVLGGTSELAEGDLAAISRAMAPPGAAVPIASMLEYPDDAPRLADINDGHGLTLLPAGDAREELKRVIAEASLAQLRAAWQAVDEMQRWAVSLCDAVEAELDGLAAKQPLPAYPGLHGWFIGITFGLNRMLLRLALIEPEPTTKARAATAMMLLNMATGMSRLRVMLPDSRFDLMPQLLPPFLQHLDELVAANLPVSLRPSKVV